MALESPLELDLRTVDTPTPAAAPAPAPTPDVRAPVVRCQDGSIRTEAGCPEDQPAGGDDDQSIAEIIAGIGGGGGGGAFELPELPQEGASLVPGERTAIPPLAILLLLVALAVGGYYLYKRSQKAKT